MPLRGKGHSDLVKDEAPYFKSLTELDAWFTSPHDKLSGVIPYQHRPHIDGSNAASKLLVCHDYKGGYIESPSALCYTFNFWHLCDTFVYFSHNRVAVPPSAWVNAAHKQGTRMLGTFIFEGLDSMPDCLQLIVGQSGYVVKDDKIPISKRYAAILAELAYQRGFDGYLLNFEFPLQHGTEQARALAAWMLLLRAELRAKVGPHAQVVWYDSVIYDGRIKYQNRLNGYNLPFFLASDTFFTNYWWVPETLELMVQYFFNYDDSLSGLEPLTGETKTLQNIYSGVDVWPGRGQYGDSGWCCYRSLTHIAIWGLSTALFAPGWTWESATEEAEHNWNYWWDTERRFWLGPLKPGEVIPVPDSPEGPFKPIAAFFEGLPPPNPSKFVFYTNFSPGVGYSWFVEGKKVLDTTDGWTDIAKQSSIGNLAWPWPNLAWRKAEQGEALPTVSTAMDMTDGYNGGNTLKFTLTYTGGKSKATKTLWLPVQSLVVSTPELFEARVEYKISTGDTVALDTHIHVQSLSSPESDNAALNGPTSVTDLSHGWTQQTIHFTGAANTTSVAIGFLVDVPPTDPSTKITFSLSLGQLVVYPVPPPSTASVGTPSVTNATFTPTPAPPNDAQADALEGVLRWDTASTLPHTDVHVDDAESVKPAWVLWDTPAYRFPTFAYFNVYAAPLSGAAVDPASAVFVGTTGFDGRANRFYVDPACLPTGVDEKTGARFHVQGVTDRGEVLPWEKCATVDCAKR